MNEEKRLLRERMRAYRQGLSEETILRDSAAVCARITALEQYRKAGTVMAYFALAGEVRLDELISDAYRRGKRVLFPCADGDGIMQAYALPENGPVRRGLYGITEPDPARTEMVEPEQIDLIIVPGVAFDRAGNRLGRGKGYYDRFLLRGHRATRVAAAFSGQVIDHMPVDAYDEMMDILVTEKESLLFQRKGRKG